MLVTNCLNLNEDDINNNNIKYIEFRCNSQRMIVYMK